MITTALAALLLAGQPAAPPRPPAVQMTPQQQMEAMTNALRQRGMSAAGIAVIQAGIQRGEAMVKAMIPKLQASGQAMQAAATAKPFRLAAFEQALRAQSALANQFEAQKTEHQLSIFRALSPADQQIYAELLVHVPAGSR